MGFVGSLFGGNSGLSFQAATPTLQEPTTNDQANTAYSQQQEALNRQGAFVAALQAQNGIGNQSAVFNQLQGVANGTGPNPALAQLNQTTGQNIAGQAALMAGQRGANSNVGLLARQIGQQGAGIQQNAAGQAATLGAQQQLGALNSLGGIAGQQVAQAGQGLQETNANTLQGQNNILNAIQGQNNANVGATSNANTVNAGIAAQQSAGQYGLLGGLGSLATIGAGAFGAAGSSAAPFSAAAFAHGGMSLENMKAGGPVPGQAKVAGDSPKNDTVNAKLSPGEIVIPRSITQHPDAVKLAAAFVQKELARHKVQKKSNYYNAGTVGDVGDVQEDEQPDPTPAEAAPIVDVPVESAPVQDSAPDAIPNLGVTASPQYVNSITNAFEGEKSATKQLGNAQAKLSDEQGKILAPTLDSYKQLSDTENAQNKDYASQHQALIDSYAQGKIDPNRLVNNMSTVGKIGTAIGLILGGIGGGGLHQENPALVYLNKQIDNDIAAQSADLGKKQNLVGMHMQNFKNVQDAQAAAKASLLGSTRIELEKAAAESNDPLAKARAQQAVAQIGLQEAQIVGPLQYKQQLLSGAGSSGSLDPAQLVQIAVPPAQQPKVIDAIGKAKHIAENKQAMLQSFDQAAKDNRTMSGGPSIYQLPGVTSPAIKALNQAEDPLLHDEVGRVNDQAKSDVMALHPQFGDNDSTIASKRKAFSSFIDNSYGNAVNTAKAHNIDLTKFAATNPVLNAVSKIPNGQAKLQWSIHNRNDPRAQAWLKKVGAIQ